MFKLGKVNEINLEHKPSWKERMFLTFDLDWCCDEVLEDTLTLLESYNANATFFVTHKTKLLDSMHLNPRYELGIHPNFNCLLDGDFRYGKNYKEVFYYYQNIVPSAVSMRSHSLTQQSPLLSFIGNEGIKYECNTFLPFLKAGVVKPFYHWDKKLMRIPHVWEDDIHCSYGDVYQTSQIINYQGIKVLDFHPIHVYLNTDSLERYENARPYLQNFEELVKFKNQAAYGVRDFLVDILEHAQYI